MSKFKYPTLRSPNSFRLLSIAPSQNPSDRLVCTLSEHDIDTAPCYVALSYCWGIPSSRTDATIALELDDGDGGGISTIRSNLSFALRQIRSDANPDETFIWADALCISQEDVAEKDVQIKAMPRIFANAVKVLSWLSRAESDADRLRTIGQFVEAGYKVVTALSVSAERQPAQGDSKAGYHALIVLIRAFIALSQHDYWRRVWIVQETGLARELEIVCGCQRISWTEFFNALDVVLRDSDDVDKSNEVARNARHVDQRRGFHAASGTGSSSIHRHNSPLHVHVAASTQRLRELDSLRKRIADNTALPLLQVLYSTRDCEATEWKDKIFALLGLVRDSRVPALTLYYGDSLEILEQRVTWLEFNEPTRMGRDAWQDAALRLSGLEMPQAYPWTQLEGLQDNAPFDKRSPIAQDPEPAEPPGYRLDLITFCVGEHGPSAPRWSPRWTDRGMWKRLRKWQFLRIDRLPAPFNATEPLMSTPVESNTKAIVVQGYYLGSICTHRDKVLVCYKRPDALISAASGLCKEFEAKGRKSMASWAVKDDGMGYTSEVSWPVDLTCHRTRLEALIQCLSHATEKGKMTMNGNDACIGGAGCLAHLCSDTSGQLLHDLYKKELQCLLSLGSSLSVDPSTVWAFHRMEFFRTTQGYLGFALSQTRPGDMLYLIEGCSVPVVVRRYGSGMASRGFVVISEMLVLGIMQGEFFHSKEASMLSDVTKNEREELFIF